MIFPQLNKVILIGHAYDEPFLRSRKPNEERVQLELVTHLHLPKLTPATLQNRTSQRVLVTTFGPLALHVAQTIHKGSCLYLEGQLYTLPKKLQERYFTEVIAHTITTIAHKRMEDLKFQ